jgi:hypothetical protein
MSNEFFEKPILNSPYGCPSRHWELDKSGQPTRQILERRRRGVHHAHSETKETQGLAAGRLPSSPRSTGSGPTSRQRSSARLPDGKAVAAGEATV